MAAGAKRKEKPGRLREEHVGSDDGCLCPPDERDPVLSSQHPISFIFPFISSPQIQPIFTKHRL